MRQYWETKHMPEDKRKIIMWMWNSFRTKETRLKILKIRKTSQQSGEIQDKYPK